MGVWLGVEGSHSFMPFNAPPMCYPPVRFASMLCIQTHRYANIRKGYVDASNKHSTASRAPSPLHVFLPDCIRTPDYTKHSGLNDVTSTGHKKVW
jgi:hypothetical protein